MSTPPSDLSALSRSGPAGAVPAEERIAMPPARWKESVLAPGVLLILAAGLIVYTGWGALTPAMEVQVAPVVERTTSVAAAEGGQMIRAPGWVEADPYPIAVSALTDGVVRDVLVLEGEPVSSGQPVAQLVDDDARLLVQRVSAELATARGELAAAEARLAAAEANWENPIEQTRAVAAARARLARTEAELARWPADLAAAEAKAAELKAELERVTQLESSGNTAAIELIRARTQHAAAAATAESTRLRQPMLLAELDELRAEVRAAEEHLRLRINERLTLESSRAGKTQAEAAVQRVAAALDEARLRLDRTTVRSTSDGVVLTRLVEPGSKLTLAGDLPRSAQVVRLYDPKRLQVRVDVPIAEASGVGVGQSAEIVVQVLPDRVFRGQVTRVMHEADVQRNTLQVKVRIDDPAPELKPEMLAQVRILAGRAESTTGVKHEASRVFAPAALILRDEIGAAFAWVVDRRRGTAVRRSVQARGIEADGWIAVEGLSPGDRLIVGDSRSLRDGARVRVTGEVAEARLATGGK